MDELDRALGEANVRHRVLRDDADHAFANPSSERYEHAHAAAAWREVSAFFQEHLHAGR